MTGAQQGPPTQVAVTVFGHDRPGIIADTTRLLAELGANLEDSTMTLLRGHFAMVLVATVPVGVGAVADALAPLGQDGGLEVSVREVQPEPEVAATGAPYLLSVHGADRPGIVSAVTAVVAAAGGNVTDLSTRLTSSDAGALYVLLAEVDLPPGSDVARLTGELGRRGAEIGVDVSLRPLDPDVL